MVQHMIDKFHQYKLINSNNNMPSGDKQQPVAVKKVALRELSSEANSMSSKPPGNAPLKDKGSNGDLSKVLGVKRQHSDCPSSSPSNHPSQGNTGANGHLVYVRRKVDTDAGKVISSENTRVANTPELKKSVNFAVKDPNVQQVQSQQPKFLISQAIPTPVVSQTPSSKPGEFMANTGSILPSGIRQHSNLHWRDRFLHLQMFLNQCEQSNQEEYIKMLRSLPPVGRSRHAVELEKRAIQLMLEEGKELQRMKVLNVLGKALPKDEAAISTHASPASVQILPGSNC